MRPYPGGMATTDAAGGGHGAPPDDVAAVERAARALLAVVARSMTSALDRVSLPQYRVLLVLCEHGEQRSGDLAELVGVHQSTLTRTADRLVALGLITRQVSPDSRREVLIDLSDEGRRLVLDVMRTRRAEVRALLLGLQPGERARIGRGMAIFAEAAGEPPQDVLRTLGV